MNLRVLLCSCIAVLPFTATADEVYSWVDESGVRHFSDKPPQGAEREQIKGSITSGTLKKDKFNTMQPYTPPRPAKLSNPIDSPEEVNTPVTVDDPEDEEKEKSASNKRSNELKSLNQQIKGYDKQERIKEIEEGRNNDTPSKPQKLNQKLKAYNDSKTKS